MLLALKLSWSPTQFLKTNTERLAKKLRYAFSFFANLEKYWIIIGAGFHVFRVQTINLFFKVKIGVFFQFPQPLSFELFNLRICIKFLLCVAQMSFCNCSNPMQFTSGSVFPLTTKKFQQNSENRITKKNLNANQKSSILNLFAVRLFAIEIQKAGKVSKLECFCKIRWFCYSFAELKGVDWDRILKQSSKSSSELYFSGD